MMREYYVLSSCDQWKSFSSMNFLGVFSRSELIKTIKRKVKKEDFNFHRELKELKNMTIRDIDSSLVYGYIQPIHLNELQD